jgi:S-adenosylmethionine:tRNA ribosyltransferase-isomerase
VRTDLLDYSLPEDLIASRPLAERDGARLLVVGDGGVEHRNVRELAELIPEGALVVVNDTRVFRARLLGKRETGGAAELLLVRDLGAGKWLALGRPQRRMRVGTKLELGEVTARVLERPGDELVVELSAGDGDVMAAIERSGHVPIPPYMNREDEPDDVTRYQTVYARHDGSVAAPTAGLHFSEEFLGHLQRRRVEIARLTLHVGPGTFKPVTSADLDEHPMHAEEIHVTDDVVQAIARARERVAPVVAIGTTVVRALESARDVERTGHVRAFHGDTRLLIQPGYEFGVVDALLTNFHMPRSTLLALVAAFAGLERMQRAYASAIENRYRFLSYGDAMWIPARLGGS